MNDKRMTKQEVISELNKMGEKPLRTMTIAVEDWEQLRSKRDELKPWAELGKLAVEAVDKFDNDYQETWPCENSSDLFGDDQICGVCEWFNFCKKRKKLEGGESHDN